MIGMIGTAWGFMKSKVGMILAIVALVLLAMWRIFAAGKESAKSEQRERRLESIATKRKIDDEIRSTSTDDLRDKLREQSGRR